MTWWVAAGLIGALALAGCDGDDPGTDSGMADAGPGEDAAPAESCSDGVLNQDETDVDCGGTCGATCLVGDMCGADGDCTTDDCGDDGTCQAMPTCSDGVMNDTETDVDCGGPMCAACDTGEACVADTDCMSEICLDDDTCAAPMCGDAVVNGTEDCDDGDGTDPVETATCDTDCTTAECGDGVVNTTASEECDGDGAGTGGETASCDSDCTAQMCGDGVVNATAGEDCDDSGESATCNANCTTSMCGDGVLNMTAGEDCDDGNTVDADGCASDCTIPRVDETISTDATFDTDTGELDGTIVAGWNPTTSTWLVNNFTLDAGVTLTVTGTAPFQVIADGDVTVNGTIAAAGEDGDGGVSCDGDGAAGGAGGPGGHAGGNGGGFGGAGGGATLDGSDGMGPGGGVGGTGDNNGGGGGGHIDRGADGTAGSSPSSGTPGTGGMFYFTPLMFQGGSGGGGGSVDDDSPTGSWDTGDDGGGGGGGGGGAVWLEGAGTVTVAGTIDVSGGDGGDDGCDAAGGGGGSGGWIRLYGGTALPTLAGATLDVSGGAGGLAGGSSGGDGGDGADGRLESGMRPLCSDGIRNFDETDVDCGGSVCGTCTLGDMCAADTDCPSTGMCLGGFCQLASCGNSTMDGSETDVDCGGADCAPCDSGEMCTMASDCASGLCETSTCVLCGDGMVHGSEACDEGGVQSATCESDCSLPTCGDGTLNLFTGELCDDGGTATGDGCGATCLVEPTPIAAPAMQLVLSGSIDATDLGWPRPSGCGSASPPADHYVDVLAIANTTGQDQTLDIEVAWAGGDGYLHVYSAINLATPDSASCIDSDDDFGGTSGSRVEGVTITSGQTLYLVLSAFSSSTAIGAYDVTVDTRSTCENGVLDSGETDVDCGGSTCSPCSATQMCATGSDCLSGSCVAGACELVPFADDFEAGAPFVSAWSTSGDAPWFVSGTSPIAGSFSAENGDIGNNEESILDLSVTCATGASVTFTFTTDVESSSSGSFWDSLEFIVDGTREDRWDGLNTATTVTFPLTAGAHTVRWRYEKDGSTSSGTDTVRIDDVSFSGCGL